MYFAFMYLLISIVASLMYTYVEGNPGIGAIYNAAAFVICAVIAASK